MSASGPSGPLVFSNTGLDPLENDMAHCQAIIGPLLVLYRSPVLPSSTFYGDCLYWMASLDL